MDKQNYTSMLTAIQSICRDHEDECSDLFTGEKLNCKLIQLRRFCIPFCDLGLFGRADENKLAFFLRTVNDDECWESTDMTHGLVLNGKLAAKKLVAAPLSSNRWENPFSDFDRWQIACWCCLEEEIADLFQQFKKEREVESIDPISLTELAKSLSGRTAEVDPIMEWWSHVKAGCTQRLRTEGVTEMCVAGLDRCLAKRWKHLEGVKYFWSEIKLASYRNISARAKEEILMKAAWQSMRKDELHDSEDVFQYLLDEIGVGGFRKFFRSGLNKPGEFDVLLSLVGDCRFDLAEAILKCISARDVDASSLFDHVISRVDDGCHKQEAEYFFLDLMVMKDPISRGNLLLRKFLTESKLSTISEGVKLMTSVGLVEFLWKTLERVDSMTILSFNSAGRYRAVERVFEQMEDEKSVEKLKYFYRST